MQMTPQQAEQAHKARYFQPGKIVSFQTVRVLHFTAWVLIAVRVLFMMHVL